MKCWTAQYRYPGPHRLDISVKGNDELGKHFAPTWEMLKEYKTGLVSADVAEHVYTQKYFALLSKRMQEDFTPFAELLKMEYVVFVCFCAADTFCHRKLLVFFLQQLGVEYGGEIKDFSKWDKKKKPFLEQITEFQDEYRWLSNFSWGRVVHDNITYETNENFYQAMKAERDQTIPISKMIKGEYQLVDVNLRQHIATLTPAQAKRIIGKRGKVKARDSWTKEESIIVMKEGLRQKFNHPELRAKLLATGNAYLQEGNRWHDNFWGVCLCDNCIGTKKAENWLGKLLMERRELLPFGK